MKTQEWEDRLLYSDNIDPLDLAEHFHPDNPKIHPAAQSDALAGAISALGWMGRPKVNLRQGDEWEDELRDRPIVIDGHDRIKVSINEGVPSIPVDYYDLSPNEERLFLLTFDPIAMMAEHDRDLVEKNMHLVNTDEPALMEMLSNLAEELNISGFGIGGVLPEDDGDAEPQMSRADELQKKWGTAVGQMWRLPSRMEGQEHLIVCGDCLDPVAVKLVMGNDLADMIFTDPPYGVAYVGKTADALTIESDDISEEQLEVYVKDWFDMVDKVSRDGAYWLATVPGGPLHGVFLNDWKRRGYLRQVLVWVKDSLVLGRSEYHYRHEPILFGWKPGNRLRNNDRTKTTVWEFDRPKASREHPTMKPVELWMHGINHHTKPGDLLFEPFSGSGTTLIAGENLSRRVRAIEILPEYVAVALDRYERAFGITPELIDAS